MVERLEQDRTIEWGAARDAASRRPSKVLRLAATHLGRSWFSCLLLVLFTGAAWLMVRFPANDRLVPDVVVVCGAIATVVDLVRSVGVRRGTDREGGPHTIDLAGDLSIGVAAAYLRFARYFGWVVSYYVVMGVFGVPTATAVFVLAFLKVEARSPWWYAGLVAFIVTYFFGVLLITLLGISIPHGLLGDPLRFLTLIRWR